MSISSLSFYKLRVITRTLCGFTGKTRVEVGEVKGLDRVGGREERREAMAAEYGELLEVGE